MFKLIKNIIVRVFNLIAGDDQFFSLEHRLFNSLILLTVIIAFLGGYYNIVLEMDPIAIYPSLIGGGIGIIFFYISRFRKRYNNLFVYVPTILTMVVISIVFFYNSGSAGPIIILLICLFSIFILISNGKTQYIVLAMLLLNVVFLYYLEYKNPQWITHYSSSEERFWDVLVTFSFAVIFMSFAIIQFKNKYNRERLRVEQQNMELAKLNSKINIQKKNLETKTLGLETSLTEIREKNEFIYSLMRELNHRVKNNLQLVTSLLNMQETQAVNKQAKSCINLAKNRIISIGLIHQKLYCENLDLDLELSEYLEELSEYLVEASAPDDQVSLVVELTPVKTNVETAVHLGLIVNELITNSLKHAWQNGDDEKRIKILSTYDERDGFLKLIVRDNGKGFNPGSEKPDSSYGLDLINSIIEQYNGSMNIRINKGAEVELRLCINQN